MTTFTKSITYILAAAALCTLVFVVLQSGNMLAGS